MIESKKQVAELPPVLKDSDQLKKENKENPTKSELSIISIIESLQNSFESLIQKPKTRHNKIVLLKINISLLYHIERLPKMNKKRVKKLAMILKEIENNNNLNELKNIERKINK